MNALLKKMALMNGWIDDWSVERRSQTVPICWTLVDELESAGLTCHNCKTSIHCDTDAVRDDISVWLYPGAVQEHECDESDVAPLDFVVQVRTLFGIECLLSTGLDV
jgi:hypothetical protein